MVIYIRFIQSWQYWIFNVAFPFHMWFHIKSLPESSCFQFKGFSLLIWRTIVVCMSSSHATASKGLLFQMAYISGSNVLNMKNFIQVVHFTLLKHVKRISFLILKITHNLLLHTVYDTKVWDLKRIHEEDWYSHLVTVDSSDFSINTVLVSIHTFTTKRLLYRSPCILEPKDASDLLPDSAMSRKPQKI